MSVDKCLEKALKYVSLDRRLLVCKIGECYAKHMSNQKLTDEDKFFLGLRYSEFLADEDSNEGYLQASIKRDAILRVLKIDMSWLISECISVCGLY